MMTVQVSLDCDVSYVLLLLVEMKSAPFSFLFSWGLVFLEMGRVGML